MLDFFLNLIITTFGVLLGLWLNSMREKYIENQREKLLSKAAAAELLNFSDSLVIVFRGLSNGQLQQLDTPPSVIVRNNILSNLPVTMRRVESIRPNKKNRIEQFIKLKTASDNVSRLLVSVGKMSSDDLSDIENLLLATREFSVDLAWHIMNFTEDVSEQSESSPDDKIKIINDWIQK